MCGITGLVNFNEGAVADSRIIEAMNGALRHRGPDDAGYFYYRNVGIGHRRLSIIDVSQRGRQPIFNEDKTIAVVLNGEIYNYRELKKELTNDGHVFYSETDTEAIVHAYEKWGISFLKYLDGMFSLALVDKPRNIVLLARDPFGKKPLYYTMQKNLFMFASEIKAFLKHPDFARTVDLPSLSKYLAYEYVPTPYSIFKDCKKLSAASYIIVSLSKTEDIPEPATYWRPVYEPKIKISEPEACTEITRLLSHAVKKRLMSDVALGVFLSGGLDSSCVAALAARELADGLLNTFSVGFTENSFDESSFSKQVASHIGTLHHSTTLNQEAMLEIFPTIIQNMDEPFADPSIIPTYLLCGFAKQYVTVVLGGDGGDELFAGYDTFLAERFSPLVEHLPEGMLAVLRKMASWLPLSEKNVGLSFKANHFLKGFIPEASHNIELRNNLWLGSFTQRTIKAILNEMVLEMTNPSELYDVTRLQKEFRRANDPLDRLIDNYISLYLHDDILVKVDRASMMHSIEVRSPFLDKSLAEFVNRLPSRMKMNIFSRKYILKKAMKNILPTNIIGRKKKGFGIPLSKWFRGELRGLLQDTFLTKQKWSNGIFRHEAVAGLVKDHINGKRDNGKQIWTLLVYKLWEEAHGIVNYYPGI
ncbi:asparagine synthase (glutamine-hydrolyzing) [Candidatus Magnetominusculus dajiuhuensis]|uniref:asparagine synthase (glutamine-hydrolyzing) n=1 Tax=Candidatus Magnetominusculus dajiuhuensis TaxID=3137712 RepID=UPI003B42F929